jgi:hypothetical protein
MDEFNAALDAALAADFRALTYHWAIDMQPVFGRENVPDLSNDFDRIVERILMVFGLPDDAHRRPMSRTTSWPTISWCTTPVVRPTPPTPSTATWSPSC